MLHASSGIWHEAQLRPFVPCAWKYSPVRSTEPCVLKVADFPSGFFAGWLLGMLSWGTETVAPTISAPGSDPRNQANPMNATTATIARIRWPRLREQFLFIA